MGDGYREQPEKLLAEFAMTRTLAACFRQAADAYPVPQSSPAANSADLLLKIMLTHQAFFQEPTGRDTECPRMERLFADGDVQEFLHVHLSEGIEWFHQERFEVLLNVLYLASLSIFLATDAASAEIVSETLRIHTAVREYRAMAESAGYRTRQFLRVTG